MDVGFHGGVRRRVHNEQESINDDDERLYHERKERLRKKHRNKIRRRILMMDMSPSRGRNSVEFKNDVENQDDDNGLPTDVRMTI